MITAFEPFAGGKINLSQEISAALKDKLKSNHHIEVEICTLPVVYDEATKIAKECFSNMNPKPNLVVSLGEGSCEIRLETAAQNRDSASGSPDNAGNIRSGTRIEKNGPREIAFRSFVLDMYCALDEAESFSLVISSSPGGFVCNNTAYRLGIFFEKLRIPYTFIHVPSNQCAPENSDFLVQSSAIKISKMLAKVSNNWSHQDFDDHTKKICNLLPTSLQQLQILEKSLNVVTGHNSKQCENSFVNKLKERLKLWGPHTLTY